MELLKISYKDINLIGILLFSSKGSLFIFIDIIIMSNKLSYLI